MYLKEGREGKKEGKMGEEEKQEGKRKAKRRRKGRKKGREIRKEGRKKREGKRIKGRKKEEKEEMRKEKGKGGGGGGGESRKPSPELKPGSFCLVDLCLNIHLTMVYQGLFFFYEKLEFLFSPPLSPTSGFVLGTGRQADRQTNRQTPSINYKINEYVALVVCWNAPEFQ